MTTYIIAIHLVVEAGATDPRAEIAAQLDTSPKAVEGLLARARKELSDLLASERTDPK